MLLRNWVVLDEKSCWYPHHDVTVIRADFNKRARVKNKCNIVQKHR